MSVVDPFVRNEALVYVQVAPLPSHPGFHVVTVRVGGPWRTFIAPPGELWDEVARTLVDRWRAVSWS